MSAIPGHSADLSFDAIDRHSRESFTAHAGSPTTQAKSLSQLLHRLILASAMPMAVCMAFALLGLFVLQERQLVQDRERLALVSKRSLDAQIGQRLRALDALAQSTAMKSPVLDFESYQAALSYRQAFNADVIVADPQGQMLVNTRVPWGRPLPMVPTPRGRSAAKEAWQRRQAAVGDLFIGPVAKTLMLALATVTLDAGEPVRTVVSTLEASLVTRWLEDIQPDGSQAIALLDSTGEVIAINGPYEAQRQAFSPWMSEHRVMLDQAPFQLVIQTNALTPRLPSVAAWMTLLMGLGLAVTVGLLASRKLASRLQEDLTSLRPAQQGLSRAFDCIEAEAVARELRSEQTAREALLDRLEDQERVQWDILHHLPMPVLVSRDGRVLQANEQAEQLFGTSADQLVGRPSADFLHPDERQRVLPLLTHIRSTPDAQERVVTRIIRGDGKVQPIEVTMLRLEHVDGPLVLSVLRAMSITEQSCSSQSSGR